MVSFDNVSHEWLVKFVEHRVADRRVSPPDPEMAEGGGVRGREVVEDGGRDSAGGGGLAAAGEHLPALRLRSMGQALAKHQATGDMVVVRYADDIVAGFENRADAERFLSEWKERMQKFGLELHPDKTRLIEFGRHASENRKQRGEDKPETFDFLGFTHMCGQTRKTGRFIVKRKTIRKRLSAKLNELKEELRRRWHEPVAEVGKWLKSVVRGYFNYHAVPGNMDSLNSFRAQVIWRWYRGASASEPARQDDLGTVLAVGRSMDSECEDPASASECALRRHSSKVGAVCSNSARTDLCGGRLGNRRPYRDLADTHTA